MSASSLMRLATAAVCLAAFGTVAVLTGDYSLLLVAVAPVAAIEWTLRQAG